MILRTSAQCYVEPHAREFYIHTLRTLNASGLPYLVGGAYALARYTGIERHTKDLDVFVRPEDAQSALDALSAAGYQCDMIFPHWLGKARCAEDFVDVIFSSGNNVARVDDGWFEHAPVGEVLGVPVMLVPAEEMIWSKGFIMERERFDGADVVHVLLACADKIDWDRLIARFGPHWRVLLVHLLMFGFVYPGERHRIPEEPFHELLRRLAEEEGKDADGKPMCQGTLLSRQQYLVDVSRWDFADARLTQGHMSKEEIAHWTAAIDEHH
ncbi:nucleotidyltransferase [Chondromyces crocatus]|uniref:nucleotidyltransferase n=1 Tax=Chondromyces crocatus TaxID=52 RepID=UPI000B1A7193|nr:nucleotidyltransferase [Chondromyces crocatus]